MPRVIVLGYHEHCVVGLEELLGAGAEVAALVTHEDSLNENLWFPTPAPVAHERGIPVYTPEDVNEPQFVKLLEGLAPDAIFSFYFRQLVKQPILDLPPLGAYNLHGSLLPKYRGRCPLNWVLVHGESETGVTLHHMVLRADAGDVVAQAAVPIDFADTALSLHHKLIAAARELLRRWLPEVLAGTAPRTVQDHAQATYFGGRKPEDGRIAWQAPADSIYNLIRAVTHPYPGAFTTYRGRRLFVWQAQPLAAEPSRGRPGEVVAADSEGLLAATGAGLLRLNALEFEGAPEMSGAQACEQGVLETGARFGQDG
ncbi:MAG: formyltransferase [Armatimonadetes bacterium CG_4_10_14_3_um_filter_66_18]|nr:formyltransferase [Armatimonadota bacterium]OIO99138.1 MAG: hypothetical protein AUJ96_20000 [Armatimonadetes bacterium CG2_30_66_41]PIU87714.1 MAG: formyltransferase [Armatimonadetes bacterium CG06_land_8_20_14_3_00_66_21]PIX48235.1 MAG: formyltransferase [Armatimonadetes bacterium CG_4_8_14_3_um_filter_66_20]PIY50094.1 MAG: formyltransferase [Armatimonadetes bacterium CG_4_10_14_3_um_filter_66_18]PJB60396.1 MAG: formyltransferase [Armatimonadetes bacterium CG_4_9_14_3_um_filter_66_14]